MVTCWEKANLLALLCVMFYCVFVTSPFGVLSQMWCLIVSIPDLCLLSYFYNQDIDNVDNHIHAIAHPFIMHDNLLKLIMKRRVSNDSFLILKEITIEKVLALKCLVSEEFLRQNCQ